MTESTWKPLTGCTKTSPGCQHCYAERVARLLELDASLDWPPNVWMGGSPER